MGDDERLHLTLTIDGAGEPIRGSVDDRRGSAVEFTGWLELMSALDAVRARAAALAGDGGPPREVRHD